MRVKRKLDYLDNKYKPIIDKVLDDFIICNRTYKNNEVYFYADDKIFYIITMKFAGDMIRFDLTFKMEV